MASVKGIKFEQGLLQHVGIIKELVLKNVGDNSQSKQDLLTAVNDFFDFAHEGARKLRKALAFLHGASDSYRLQLGDNNIVPDEFYGRPQDAQNRRPQT